MAELVREQLFVCEHSKGDDDCRKPCEPCNFVALDLQADATPLQRRAMSLGRRLKDI